MTAADRIIRRTTALAVVGVAAVAAVVSYEHASALVREHGESGWTGRLIPLTVDGLIYASSMVMLDSARRGVRVPVLARWLLGLGIVTTLAANVAHGLAHGLIGAAISAWPAVALVGSYELLTMIVSGAQAPKVTLRLHDGAPVANPLEEQAAVVFAAELGADRVPSVRAIRAALHIGQPRAQRLREYLAAAADAHGGNLAA
jgi:xanthosine utilization system XapX-like protein